MTPYPIPTLLRLQSNLILCLQLYTQVHVCYKRIRSGLTVERLRFTFTPNGKREFVPRDQIPPYFSLTVYCFYTKISSFMLVLSKRIVLDCFISLFSILRNSQLTFAVSRMP